MITYLQKRIFDIFIKTFSGIRDMPHFFERETWNYETLPKQASSLLESSIRIH